MEHEISAAFLAFAVAGYVAGLCPYNVAAAVGAWGQCVRRLQMVVFRQEIHRFPGWGDDYTEVVWRRVAVLGGSVESCSGHGFLLFLLVLGTSLVP